MKKRTKTLLALSAALCLSFGIGTLAACGGDNPPDDTTHTQHVDVDPQDGKCDVCGADMEQQPDPTASYKVTFSTDGGSSVPEQGVTGGGKATKPGDPTKAGHVFAGWYKDADCTEEFDFDAPITADTTVYAKWDVAGATEESYFVSSDLGDGTVSIAAKPATNLPQDVILPSTLGGKKVTAIAANAFETQKLMRSVTIPDTVLSIGERAFFNATNLAAVNGAENVESLGSSVFAGTAYDSALPVGEAYVGKVLYKYAGSMFADTEVTVKEGVVSIAGQAFQDLEKLTKITLPSTLKEIGNYAFGGTAKGTGLTEIVIPDSVVTIGANAFRNAKKLAKVTIGKGVQSIGTSAFNGTAISELNYNAVNATLAGELFSGFETEATLTIGDDVETLPANLASGWTGVKTLTLGAKISEIPANMFDGLSNLSALTVKGTLTKIGNYAFRGTKLTAFTVGEEVTSIGAGAFANCRDLTSLTYNAAEMTLGAGVFSGSKLANVTFGDAVTAVPAGIFANVSTLTTVAWGNVSEIGDRAFMGTGLSGAFTLESSVRKVGEEAFSGAKFTSVTIPVGVTELGAGAFGNITTLTAATFNARECTLKGDHSVFEGSTALETLTIGTSVTKIPAHFVEGNEKITTVTLPDGISEIGEKAFYNCSKLATLTGVDNASSVGADAFTGTPYLNTYLQTAQGCVYLGTVLYAYNGDLPADGKVTIKETTTAISANVFKKKTGLKEINIPTTVETIGASAFEGCSNLEVSINLTNVKEIGDNAFNGCAKVTEFKFGSSLVSIGESAFSGCTKATIGALVLPECFESIGTRAFDGCSGVTALEVKEGSKLTEIPTYCFNGAKFTSVKLSSSVERLGDSWANQALSGIKEFTMPGVKYIGSYGLAYFQNALPKESWIKDLSFENIVEFGDHALFSANITSITFGANLEKIGVDLFGAPPTQAGGKVSGGTNSLTSVDFRKATKLTAIPMGAFTNCQYLETVYMPTQNVEVGDFAFNSCYKLLDIDLTHVISIAANAFSGSKLETSNIKFSKDLTYIGDYAFSETNLKGTITLGQKLTVVGGAFTKCLNLHSVIVEGNIESLSGTFIGCTGITSIQLAEGVKEIETAFDANIKTLTIPSSVTKITGSSAASSAFGRVEEVIFKGASTATVNQYSFYDTTKAIYVPEGQAASFRSATGWANFASRIYEEGWKRTNGLIIENGVVIAYLGSGTSVELPADATGIRAGAIPTSITQITVNTTNPALKAVGSVVYSQDGKTLVLYLASLTAENFEVPADVTAVSAGAFANNKSLKEVSFKQETPPTLGEGAFDNTSSILILRVPAGKGETYKAASVWAGYKGRIMEVGEEMPEWIVDDSGKITAWNGDGTEVVIPAQVNGTTVTGVAQGAFTNNPNHTNITKITFNSYLSFYSSEESALSGVTEIVYNSAETGKGRESGTAMFYNNSLQKVTFGADVVEVPASFCGFAYNLQEVAFLGTKVTTIGATAFYLCRALTTCTLPDSVTTIGGQAFRNSGITTLTIPKAVTSIGNQAFNGMKKLEKIIFNATAETVTMPTGSGSVPFDATVGSELEEGKAITVEFGRGVKTIPNYMFTNLSKLKEITIPASVTSIGLSCFMKTGLTSVTFADGINITTLPASVFNGCTSLVSIKLPEGITELGNMVFSGCTALKTVDLPSTLTKLGTLVFNKVTLDTLVIRATSKVIEGDPKVTMAAGGKIYAPQALIDSYKADSNWKKFADNFTSLDTYSEPAAVSYELPEAILPEKKN